ncbi:5-dehydro-4-deoxyglucarate dehydratase [Cryobacterium tagatosivorans]|nr:5-dehydro-4-deoxyglucarate dehydratase [Cryobacterium tagatosivorans]
MQLTTDLEATIHRAERMAEVLKERMGAGVLAFPLSPFTVDGADIDVEAFRGHLRRHISAGASALFVCCGTGEFPALSEDEYAQLIAVAVEEAGGKTPILAGVGYGWAQAVRFARIADEAGADGALVMPHYLVHGTQLGLVRQIEAIAGRTELPLIVYQRGLVSYSVPSIRAISAIPTVIGLKDGRSDFGQLQQLKLATAPEFLYFNGALTAEMQARPYSSIGVSAYSSAVHSFAPEIASAFFAANQASDDATIDLLLREFYSPFVELRDRQAGYAVSLIKTAARLRGDQVGPVRAPLLDPVGADLADLEAIVTRGLALVGASL